MKHTDDEKLLMIYFNEAAQKDINKNLKSTESCEKLDQLEADMNAIEQAQNQHQLPEDYGQQLWNKIADDLTSETNTNHVSKSWFTQLKQMLMTPQYSLASFAMVATLVSLAFFAGRSQNDVTFDDQLQEQLLAQNIQLHLTQSEIFLTQVSNGAESFDSQSAAQRLLSSNRIFKRALANYEGQFTNQILQDLEPILLEYANGVPNESIQFHGKQQQVNESESHWFNEINASNLMFQIKAMKQQLSQKNDII